MHLIDHPHCRRAAACPLCDGPKQTGCIMCWECHRITEAGTREQREIREAQFDSTESRLEAEDEKMIAIFRGETSHEQRNTEIAAGL